ncbi:MAG: Tic22 family protein [Cyanobacteria bacterium P01_H01_bin.105]
MMKIEQVNSLASGVSMKALFGRLLCGLLGSGVIAATLHTPQAVALSEDELLAKFAEVPVFVVADNTGGYVTSVVDLPNDGMGNVSLLRVFFSEDDVLSFVEQVRQEEPQFNRGGSVGVIDLASVHLLAQEEREVPLRLIFIPQADDLEAARGLDSEFGGNTSSSLVPLFALQDASGNYLPLSVGGESEESIFSMFFSKQDADSVLTSIQQSNPDLGQVNIGVVSLAALSENVLGNDDEAFERIRFLPDSEVVNHIQGLDLE